VGKTTRHDKKQWSTKQTEVKCAEMIYSERI